MFGKRIGKAKWVYMAPAGEGGDAGGGGDTGAAAIAAALAAQADADKAAADKAVADKAAADKAAADKAAGKAGPTDEEARLLKENMQKKEALTKAKADLADMTEKLKQFEGIDAAAIKTLLADQKTAEETALAAKGDWDRLKQRMAEEHAKELKTAQDALAEALGSVKAANGQINELSIGTLFGQSKFIADELTLTPAKARLIYAEHFDLEDGKVVGYDKPRGDKSRTAIVDAYGNGMAFDAAMQKIIDADPEKDYLYKSKLKPGAGSDSKKIDVKPHGETKTGLDKISEGMKTLGMPT